MDDVKQRLMKELNSTVARLRQMGGGVVLEEFPGSIADSSSLADDVDVIRQNEDREMSFATRSLLVERANKLAEALERLQGGEYGVCEECGEDIAPARLRAMPEVTTCVRCQDRLERSSRSLQPAGADLFGDEGEEE
jgi:DnaK suppressor protein